MPLVCGFPSWKNINSQNSTSLSGQTDNMTGQPWYGEGLYPGIYADLTNKEALDASDTATGILYNGRYRWVLVDSGATAANVKTGTVGFMRQGTSVASVVVLTEGTGQTVGTYRVAATGGGGTGALIQVVVTSATEITVTVLNGGYGYTSVPTFTLVTGGTPGTVVAQLNSTPNIVTSADVATNFVRPVVFLNSITPGNYGFVQELGLATVLATASQTQAANQFAIVKSSLADGTMTASSATFGPYAIGSVVDPIATPLANTPFKILLDGPCIQD